MKTKEAHRSTHRSTATRNQQSNAPVKPPFFISGMRAPGKARHLTQVTGTCPTY